MIEISLEKWPLSRLKEYENNTKEHPEAQIKLISESIAQFDFNDPIGVDENGVILEGHGRLAAARRLGLTEVPVLVLKGIDGEKAKALYRIAHNKLTLSSGFDVRKLSAELAALSQFDEVDINSLGFSAKDINTLMSDSAPTEFRGSVYRYTMIFNEQEPYKKVKAFIRKLQKTDESKSMEELLTTYLEQKAKDL